MPQYKFFKIRHPDYDSKLWEKCRAFYAGGERLLKNEKLLRDVFPPHLEESPAVYKERRKRAFYIPYAGEIVNSILAGLFSEELKLRGEEPEADDFFEEFIDDVSPPGGRTMSLEELLKEQTRTALLCRRAWTLVDLPSMPPGEEAPTSLAEEEALGLNDAYAVPIDPEMVLDWEENEDGELDWAMVHHKTQRRDGILSTRNIVREEFTVYYTDRWERYAIEYEADKLPQDNDEVTLVDSGIHSFGRVPLVRLQLDEGMWAMGKVLPIAIAHLNLRNALSWAEYKSLFPVLASYKQGIDLTNPVTENVDRDIDAVYGQGYMISLAEKDRLEWVGASSEPFMAAMHDLNGLRDEMHRVLHQMALSVDNSGAALQRSADSKQVDQSVTAIVLKALAYYVREHAVELMKTAQAGRGDKVSKWSAEGMESYDEISTTGLLDQAQTVDLVSIPSARFKKAWTFKLARRLLGPAASDEELEEIREELEKNITNEMFDPMLAGILGSGDITRTEMAFLQQHKGMEGGGAPSPSPSKETKPVFRSSKKKDK